MVVVIVKWYIKNKMDKYFLSKWEEMKPKFYDGLFREFLNKPENINADKYLTLDVVNPNYTTYLNVGIWRSLEDFDKAIGSMIPQRKPNKRSKETIVITSEGEMFFIFSLVSLKAI